MELLRFAPSWGAVVLRPYGKRRYRRGRLGRLCGRSRRRLQGGCVKNVGGPDLFGTGIILSECCVMARSFQMPRGIFMRIQRGGNGIEKILRGSYIPLVWFVSWINSEMNRVRCADLGLAVLRSCASNCLGCADLGRSGAAPLHEGGGEEIDHQADGGLGGAAGGVAIRVYLDDVEAYQLSFFRNALH